MRPTLADPATHVWAQLRPADREWLWQLAQAAGSSRLALVGGAVRDALLGRTPSDLDIVVEDAAGGAVERLAQAGGGPFVFHPAFQNATLTLPDGGSADLVRARRETYPQPGRNPVPSPGTLEDDLCRRDFAVNALALVLRPDAAPEVLDVVGGLSDLERAELRPLHSQSFHEDASRLVRGARLAARLGLHATPELLAQVPAALAQAHATPRLWAEAKLLLAEPRPGAAAAQLHDWGAGELLPGLPLLRQLDALQDGGEAVTPAVYSAALL
ncbi:MAG: CCA tRNA nucleotidyltransferase, partial [Deinococcus sp.]|uniref:CCA tRNA nucleotidyltransferase n=1 Tax=Deinococcus sp. TaxID=47478 RepID=UPI0026DC06E7